jgi:hypothetical protein
MHLVFESGDFGYCRGGENYRFLMKSKLGSLGRAAILVLSMMWGTLESRGVLINPQFGKASPVIGTFNGWTAWVGWEANFSENYNAQKEKYAWMIFFAPEAIYAVQQGSMADYSGVDVSMGFKYFYGFLKSPSLDQTLTTNYLSSLWSISISKESIPLLEGAGPMMSPMSHLSMGLEVEAAFFRVEHTRKILPGLQFGAGFSVAYSLLPIQLPICVEIDKDWIPNSYYDKAPFIGFYPIAKWGLVAIATQDPAQQIQVGLEELARDTNQPATAFAMAGMLAPVMQKVAADPDFQAFFANPTGGGRYSQALTVTENWLDSGNPPPISVIPPDEKKVPEVVKPVLVGTQLGFQTAYRVGAQSNPLSKWTYVDGIITNYCYTGERIRVELKAQELSALVPGTVPADFEGAPIGFTLPQEYLTSYAEIGSWQWVKMTNGTAELILNQSFSTPQIVRVRYSDAKSTSWPWRGNLNSGISIELKSHLLVFLDPTDLNGNGIPDFWEQQHGLTNSVVGADTDHDGFTDLQEYIAGTNPTDPNDYPRLTLPANLFQTRNLTVPYTDSARRYTIEGNTNAALLSNQWFVVEDFFGENAPSDVDISSYLRSTNAVFRLKIRRY